MGELVAPKVIRLMSQEAGALVDTLGMVVVEGDLAIFLVIREPVMELGNLVQVVVAVEVMEVVLQVEAVLVCLALALLVPVVKEGPEDKMETL